MSNEHTLSKYNFEPKYSSTHELEEIMDVTGLEDRFLSRNGVILVVVKKRTIQKKMYAVEILT